MVGKPLTLPHTSALESARDLESLEALTSTT